MKESAYVICPVREVTPEEKRIIDDYVNIIESEGCKTHYPLRDVNQIEPIGLRILTEHRDAMKNVTKTIAYWNGRSQGSFFDLGMSFMSEKPFSLMNLNVNFSENEMSQFVFSYAFPAAKPFDIYHELKIERETIKKSKLLEYEWKDSNWRFLFNFGMAFMSEKPVILKNRKFVEQNRTSHKSFQNVLLALDEKYRLNLV